MVLVSTAAVAVVAHKLHPSFTWAAAITLGAIVSPPDPVAVLSIMRSLRVPRALVSILEGEGLVNDATALVTYRLAVAAVVTGAFSLAHAAVEFLVVGAGGIAIGLLIGVIVARVHRVTRSVPAVSNTVSLLTPFASYLYRDQRDLSRNEPQQLDLTATSPNSLNHRGHRELPPRRATEDCNCERLCKKLLPL